MWSGAGTACDGPNAISKPSCAAASTSCGTTELLVGKHRLSPVRVKVREAENDLTLLPHTSGDGANRIGYQFRQLRLRLVKVIRGVGNHNINATGCQIPHIAQRDCFVYLAHRCTQGSRIIDRHDTRIDTVVARDAVGGVSWLLTTLVGKAVHSMLQAGCLAATRAHPGVTRLTSEFNQPSKQRSIANDCSQGDVEEKADLKGLFLKPTSVASLRSMAGNAHLRREARRPHRATPSTRPQQPSAGVSSWSARPRFDVSPTQRHGSRRTLSVVEHRDDIPYELY